MFSVHNGISFPDMFILSSKPAQIADKRYTVKADAFTVVFERAKSSPLTRQPDFMHM